MATSDIPSTMTAIQQNGYGEARNVLTLEKDVALPQKLSSNQILVRVYAASINPLDWKLLHGNLALVKRPSFPHIPGNDVAGVVVKTGSSVTRFKAGDKVYGYMDGNGGTYAEYICEVESQFALKPSNLSMIEAAAVPLACETSYQVLFKRSSPPIGPGSKIFVCGGATATGLYAIQLAKAVGAHVATTISQRNFSLLEKLGYKLVHEYNLITNDSQELFVIDYNTNDFAEILRGQNYDLVYDCVGGEQQWVGAQQILKQGGQFITIAGDNPEGTISFGSIFTIGSRILSRKLGSVFRSPHHSYIIHFIHPVYQELDDMRVKYLETGKVKPLIDTIFDWRINGIEAVYELFEKSKSGKSQGKLILNIADES